MLYTAPFCSSFCAGLFRSQFCNVCEETGSLAETLLNPVLLVFWGVVFLLIVGGVGYIFYNRHKLKRFGLQKNKHR